MLRFWLAGVAVGLLLASGSPVRAGLYDPRQPTSPLVTESGVRPLPFELFRDLLTDTLRIADPLQTRGLRPKYLERRKTLLVHGLGSLNSNELAELGAVQWRLRDSDGAFTALRMAESRDPRNYWVLIHQGTVHQAMGQLREAATYLATAREFFPSPWPTGPAATGPWFRQAEQYQMTLLRLRMREDLGQTGRRTAAADVDALFPVKFVGPSGPWEAAKLADSERARLPADAIAVVQQLLLWFPADTRLYWLLGELYNAQGDLASADAVFEECVWSRRYESPALREHRRLVKSALAAQPKVTPANDATPAPPKPILLLESWKVWAVGLACVAVALLLGYLQVRELLRRRRSPVPPSA